MLPCRRGAALVPPLRSDLLGPPSAPIWGSAAYREVRKAYDQAPDRTQNRCSRLSAGAIVW